MTPHSLTLTGDVHIADEADTLYDDLAVALTNAALTAVSKRGVFHLALSGGSTPEPFYIRLVTDPRFRALPWERTHAWIVDERRVPESDEKSNYRMISETLLDHVPMKRRQRHPILATEADPASLYEEQLLREFRLARTAAAAGRGAAARPQGWSTGRGGATSDEGVPRLDFVLLGMGEDGHTASLFPGSPAIDEQERWVAVNDGPRVTPPPRVTMTYPLLNAAAQVVVLVTGAKKNAMLQRVSYQLSSVGPDPERLPITGIEPEHGTLTWYLDAEAAGTAETVEID